MTQMNPSREKSAKALQKILNQPARGALVPGRFSLVMLIARMIAYVISLVFAVTAGITAYFILTHLGGLEALDGRAWLYGVGELLRGAITYIVTLKLWYLAAPAVVLTLLGEVFSIRSFVYYALAGAVSAIALPMLIGQAEAWKFQIPNQEYLVLFGASGVAAGLVYWLVSRPRRSRKWRG